MSDPQKDIYDFSKLEDMFDAIDTLTRATAVLNSVDKQLASDLVKMTNTLIELSQDGGTQRESAVPAVERDVVENDEDLDDLTMISPKKHNRRIDTDDDVIIDVLTGEPISK